MKTQAFSLFCAGFLAAALALPAAATADSSNGCASRATASAPASPSDLDAAAFAAHESVDPASPYDALYPYYVEMCSVGQRQPTGEKREGAAGHMVTYIKGLCRDQTSAMPRLEPCNGDVSSPETGVGISVDSDFKNVNWSAVDGKTLFLKGAAGDVPPSDENQIISRTIDDAVAQGAFRNIVLNDKVEARRPADESHEHFVARTTIGTDYALSISRRTDCVRIPIKKEMLEPIMMYLNGKNEKYFATGQPFHWSGIYDNCAHLAHNLLAAAGLLPYKRTGEPLPLQLLNLSVPADELLGQIKAGNDEDLLLKPGKIYRSEWLRSLLERQGMLPFQDGVLLEQVAGNHDVPKHFTANDVMWRPEHPLDKYNESKLVTKLAAEPRYTDLATNLRDMKTRVDAAIAARGASYAPAALGVPGARAALTGRALFDAEFDAYLEATSNTLNERLARLARY